MRKPQIGRPTYLLALLAVMVATMLASCAYLSEMLAQAAYDRKDYTLARQRWISLAQQGSIKAGYMLGYMYFSGTGVEQNFPEAARWFLKGAENGDPRSQNSLAAIYGGEPGVPRNDKEAAKWYLAAAKQGQILAQVSIGVCYYSGLGMAQSFSEAAKWYRLAADQGDGPAQYNLALMYFKGEGVTRNYAESYVWFSLAAKSLDTDVLRATAQHDLDQVSANLTAQEIREARDKVASWKPRAHSR